MRDHSVKIRWFPRRETMVEVTARAPCRSLNSCLDEMDASVVAGEHRQDLQRLALNGFPLGANVVINPVMDLIPNPKTIIDRSAVFSCVLIFQDVTVDVA